jgi:Alpha/beta hydrolase domain containing 18
VAVRPFQRILGGAAAAVDRAATLAAYAGSVSSRRKSRAERLGHGERMQALAQLAQLYPHPNPAFFRPPRAIEPSERRVRWSADGHQVIDLSWPSEYRTFEPGIAERYERHAENRLAAARLLLGPEPRPVAILIHGYMAGRYDVEQRIWPVEWFDRIGLDVALFVLPFHGVRGSERPLGQPPPFPGSDPRMTNEGFRQAMGDFRDLVAWLEARGHGSVGVMGMSLGGYTTALAATVEPSLSFAVPIIPLASLADFARDQGRLGESPAHTELQHRALDAVHRVVSPLNRKPAISGDRVLVVGARADRITPVAHARKIAHHFGAPLDSWHGGHLLQFGRADKFRRIGRLLDELGLTRRR